MEQKMRKKTDLSAELMASLQQAVDMAKGKRAGKSVSVRMAKVIVGPINIQRVRFKLKLTQEHMALLLGVSVSGYRKWEQGQRQPQGAAQTLLRIMDKEPAAVARAVKSAA
jgi:putative transcriptional regulator